MKKYAYVSRSGGSVLGINTLYGSAELEDGTSIDADLFVKIVPDSTDETTFPNQYYWKDNEWKDKPPCPGQYYYWTSSYEWQLDLQPLWDYIRMSRDTYIANSDWTQVPDAALTEEKKAEWRTYRQALRDLPATYADAQSEDEITWPKRPS
jgi:hypothetical protein